MNRQSRFHIAKLFALPFAEKFNQSLEGVFTLRTADFEQTPSSCSFALSPSPCVVRLEKRLLSNRHADVADVLRFLGMVSDFQKHCSHVAGEGS